MLKAFSNKNKGRKILDIIQQKYFPQTVAYRRIIYTTMVRKLAS